FNAQADIAQRFFKPHEVARRNVLVGHDEHALARRERANELARLIEQPRADHDVVGALAQFYAYSFTHGASNLVASARSAASTAALCGPGLDSITKSASA